MSPLARLGQALAGGASSAGPVTARPFAARLVDHVQLTKPRIGTYVLFAAFTGGLLATGGSVPLARVATAALLVAAVAAASCVFNQVLEIDIDRRMQRTAGRPLPAGRLSMVEAVVLGSVLAVTGTVGLAVGFNLLAALLALSTLVAYALVYTPLKRHSSFNTLVGAVPGAMPPLLGFVAIAGAPGPWGWMLFAVVFAWQFPHFLAIAWLYREDYGRAGLKMLPALEGCDGLAGRQALMYSLLLLPMSLLPGVRGDAGITYTIGALVLGAFYVAASGAFAWRETRRTARLVLFVSLLYLPLLLSAALIDPVVALALIQ